MIQELFHVIDRKDASGFVAFFSEDASFQFGNFPPVKGVHNIQTFVAGFFDSIQSLSHQVEDNWSIPDGQVCRGQVRYTRHDGTDLEVPFAVIMQLDSSRITQYQIYADTSGLYA